MMLRRKKSLRHPNLLLGRPSRSAARASRPQDRRRPVTTHTPPPVLSRVPMRSSSPTRPNLKRSARRRFDVALNTQGTEIRLPALPRVHIGWRVVSFAAAALLAYLLYLLWNSQTYRVEAAEVDGLQRLSADQVNAFTAVAGKRIFDIDARSLQKSLKDAFPEFSAVTVSTDLPNTVVISVTERVPVLIWHQDGRSILVDAHGIAFPAREGAANGSYPVVEAAGDPPALPGVSPSAPGTATLSLVPPMGNPSAAKFTPASAKAFLSPEMVSAILVLASRVPQGAPIVYRPDHGFGWKDARGWEAFLGDAQNMEMKLRVYQAIVDKLNRREQKPSMISVEYVYAPYLRLEKTDESNG